MSSTTTVRHVTFHLPVEKPHQHHSAARYRSKIFSGHSYPGSKCQQPYLSQLNPPVTRDKIRRGNKLPVLHRQRNEDRFSDMQSFSGPFTKNLSGLRALLSEMPERYKTSFTNASKEVLQVLCDPGHLHVWESDSDLDNLLQLTSVIARVCRLGGDRDNKKHPKDGMLVIIAEEKPGRDNFARICELVKHLKDEPGNKCLERKACTFDDVVVVKGWNNAIRGGEHAERVAGRISLTLERVIKKRKCARRNEKIVWHHGPVLHQLLLWISKTTPELRTALVATTITGSLILKKGVAPSTLGRMNTVSDLGQLNSYASKLDIPVVFLDSPSLLIEHDYLGIYVYFYAYYINMLLPSVILRPHYNRALDELITFCFRLRAASANKFGADALAMVKIHLEAGVAGPWTRSCMKANTYEKAKCKKAAKDKNIHHAVQLAEAPFVPFSPGSQVSAFARLNVGPAASCTKDYHIAAPVDIRFKNARFRLALPARFYILLPTLSQNAESVTNRIQGLMMAVITQIREIRNPGVKVENDKRKTWKIISTACLGVLDSHMGDLPDGTDEKIKFVKERLKAGTWATTLSNPKPANDKTS